MAAQNPPRDGEGDRAKRGGGGVPSSLRQPEVYEARRARREMSLPEVLLWQRLKGSPQGIAFRKQHPIGNYRADFYCAAAKLVIEVDGVAHDMGDRPQRDAERTTWLESQGYRIIRIPVADVLKDADQAAQSIVSLAARPLHRPSDGPQRQVAHPPGMSWNCWGQFHLALRAGEDL
jgi:very-short-patch-repair endonuclease